VISVFFQELLVNYCSLIAALSAGIMLAGCGAPGSSSSVVSPFSAIRSGTTSKQSLLYFANGESHTLAIYTYPQGKYMAQGTDMTRTTGLCSDDAGNVYATSDASSAILEYAHGSATPFRTLVAPESQNEGCGVDPVSGNLAVENAGLRGGVQIFNDAQGTATIYKDQQIDWYYSCAYDDHGNLFVAGIHGRQPNHWKNVVLFAELKRGGKNLKTVPISQQFNRNPGILWDGKYIAITGDYEPALYRYESRASGLTYRNSVSFSGGATPTESWVQGGYIAANAFVNSRYAGGIWRYAQGGKPKVTIGGGGSFAVSVAP
jgi:hypothetical protein